MKKVLIALLLALPMLAQAALPVGEVPKSVRLSGSEGGKVKGGAWSSEEMKGKLHVLFYVDPDEKELNDHATEQLKNAPKDYAKYGSVAVINMDATWLPNAAINSSLKSKQEQFPNTVYVMDKDKVLVKKWRLGDDNNDIVVLDPEGKVLFSKDGKLTQAEIDKIIGWIKQYAPAP